MTTCAVAISMVIMWAIIGTIRATISVNPAIHIVNNGYFVSTFIRPVFKRAIYIIICNIVMCVYRLPIRSLDAFNKLCSDMFVKIQHQEKYVYMFGDCNVNTTPNIKGKV